MSDLFTMSPAEFCSATNACKEGRDWALTQPTMADVWDNCPRADWLLWISDKLGHRPDDRTLRSFAIWCARNTPLADGRKTGDLLTDPRSLAALEVAEKFAHGRATTKELAAARDTAWAVVDAAQAAGAAARAAAQAAAWAAVAAAVAAAVDAARDAARAAVDAAAVSARDTAWNAQSAYFRTLTPNPFRKEAQP